MRRVDSGDYVCWSNDRTRLWRFHRYEDGRIHGLEVTYESRTFWRACWVTADEAGTFTGLPNPWDPPWHGVSEMLPSRQAAIDVMLAAEPVGAESP
jgi:hypothetical protein